MNSDDALIGHLKKSNSALLPRAHVEGRYVHVRLVMPAGQFALCIKTPGEARFEAATLRFLAEQLDAAADTADQVTAAGCEGSA